MPPTNVAVPRKSSWTSPRLPSVTKGKSLFEKEMELEQHLMKNLLIRGNGSKPIQIVKGWRPIAFMVFFQPHHYPPPSMEMEQLLSQIEVFLLSSHSQLILVSENAFHSILAAKSDSGKIVHSVCRKIRLKANKKGNRKMVWCTSHKRIIRFSINLSQAHFAIFFSSSLAQAFQSSKSQSQSMMLQVENHFGVSQLAKVPSSFSVTQSTLSPNPDERTDFSLSAECAFQAGSQLSNSSESPFGNVVLQGMNPHQRNPPRTYALRLSLPSVVRSLLIG